MAFVSLKPKIRNGNLDDGVPFSAAPAARTGFRSAGYHINAGITRFSSPGANMKARATVLEDESKEKKVLQWDKGSSINYRIADGVLNLIIPNLFFRFGPFQQAPIDRNQSNKYQSHTHKCIPSQSLPQKIWRQAEWHSMELKR